MRACIFTDLCAAKAPQQVYIRGVSLSDNTAKARQPAAVYTATNYLYISTESLPLCSREAKLLHIQQQRQQQHIYMAEVQKAQRQMDVIYMRGVSPLAGGRGKSST